MHPIAVCAKGQFNWSRSVVSTFFMVSDAGVGTIIGSAIFNIFVIVGATGYIACKGGKVPLFLLYFVVSDSTLDI